MFNGTRMKYTYPVAGFFVLIVAVVVFLGPSPAVAWQYSIQVTKTCTDASGQGEPIYFSGIVTNTSLWTGEDLEVTVTDDHAGIVFGPETILQGDSRSFSGNYIPTTSPSTNTVTALGVGYDKTVVDYASATCEIQDNGGGEGCTPGFWKNHLDLWPAGFSPADSFAGIFGVDLGFDTLGEGINAKGNHIKSLVRHGVAALLNAASPDVDYDLTIAEVILAVQTGDKYTLVDFNELNAPGFCD